jgi:chromosome segregation ATPase
MAQIILIGVLSAYYEQKLKRFSNEQKTFQEKVLLTTGQVIQGQLNETTRLKESALKDKETLESGYIELKSENSALRKEKEKLQAEANSLQSELETEKSNFKKLQIHYKHVQDSLINANEQISSLISRNTKLCEKIKENGIAEESC